MLQVELIDVERGERAASIRATGKERDTKITAGVSTDYGSMDMGSATFQNTVLGKATRKAVDQAVKEMLPKLQTSVAAVAGASGKAPAAARPVSEGAARPGGSCFYGPVISDLKGWQKAKSYLLSEDLQ